MRSLSENLSTAPADDEAPSAHAIQNKWQKYWADNGTFLTGGDDDTRPRRYVLAMFPYPSGDLHMGHAENYLYSDIVARFWRHRGHNVLNPIGWDSFGLPAENAAIRQGADPREWTYQNIAQQKVGFEAYGVSFDWSRVLHTSDPEYYRWNQWLFLKLYERGLAYRKKSPVNWCPNDQTVLANEQVVDGRCDRCGAEVIKKKLTQWYFRITDYADRLLDDLNQLEGFWPHKVLQMQRNWIGRSVGADVDFLIEGREEPVTVFSTRPDTLHGATFFVVAPDSDLASELAADAPDEVRQRFQTYLEQVRRRPTSIGSPRTVRRPASSSSATRSTPSTAKLPVWAADYVLADYGHGAVMAVPARPARLGLRPRVRPARQGGRRHDGPRHRCHAGDRGRRGGRADRHRCRARGAEPRDHRHRAHGRGSHDQLRGAERTLQAQCHRAGDRAAGGHRYRSCRQELPSARLAHLASAVLGHADPDAAR